MSIRIHLRDLFWLLLFTAIAIGCLLDRRAAAKTIAAWPQKWSAAGSGVAQVTLRKQVESLTDEELVRRFASYPVGDPARSEGEHLYLLELARRGLTEPLRAARERVEKIDDEWQRENADVVTALRRAEGKPDPLQARVEIVAEDDAGQPSQREFLRVWIENVDPEATIYLHFGGDYRSGRRERWRIELTSTDGRRVPDAYYPNLIGGGLGQTLSLPTGAGGKETYILDPRKFVSPPPPGRYSLRVRHSNQEIANSPDTTDIITWTSDPVDVVVKNRIPGRPFSAFALTAALILAGIAAFVSTRLVPAVSFSSRDVHLLALAILTGVAWTLDQQVMVRRIEEVRPHTHASWTLHRV